MKISAAGLALCCWVSVAMAGETPSPGQDAPEESFIPEAEQHFVCYEPEGGFSLGYRWFSGEKTSRGAEYKYPHSSLTFDMDLLSCPLPYRYHLNTEFLSKNDYYGDGGFAYKDIVLFRDILVGAHHALPHFPYQFSGEPPGLIYTERNAGDQYDVDYISNLLSLRLKTPDFPAHAFVTHRHVEQEGTIQQRFLLGTFGDLNKVSESRDIDWKSDAVKLGVNSHVGPTEIEYATEQFRFDPGRNNILFDGDPHDVVPETEASAHTVKLHSSYTGGIVTAASLGNLSQKNNYSQTESTTWKGAFDFSWIPDPLVGLFFKYRHKDVSRETTENTPVRGGISFDKDVFSFSSRYKPWNILSLFATYEFSHLTRDDASRWDLLPERSDIHSLNFTAQARPSARVKMKASYEYTRYDHPAYNSTPDNSNKLRLTTTYTPAPWVSLYLEYILQVTERDSLRYFNVDPAVILETGGRDGRRDQFLASLSTELSPKVFLTASWFYHRWDVEHALAYKRLLPGDVPGLAFIDAAVPYSDQANSFSLSLQFLPREDITVSAGVSYTIAKGSTGYTDVVGGAPFSLSSFSALKTTETGFSLAVAKKLSKEWDVGIRSYLDTYKDKAEGLLNGSVFSTTISIKRYF